MRFRSLATNEIEILRIALELVVNSPGATVSKYIRDGAASMLEQKMPDNFLWRQS